MHQVSANYTMPTILNTASPSAQSAQANTAKAKANATGSATNTNTGSSSSSSGSSTDLSTTFMTLLAQELQDQDPTAPVDPTAMVGQMISLNQLEQLISINQTVTGSSTGTSTTPDAQAKANANAAQAAYAATAATTMPAANGAIGSTSSPWTAATTNTQLPFDPNTMMPVGSTNTGATSVGSSFNPAAMGFSGTNNNTSGGK